MSKVREAIEIAAPIDEVFAFFDDIRNAPILVAGLIEVTTVEELATGGRRVEYTTRNRAGGPVTASSEHVEHDPPRRTVTRSVQSGVETTSTREFVETTSSTTRVVATIEWSAPVKFVSGLVGAPLRGPFRRSMRASLESAKAAIEA